MQKPPDYIRKKIKQLQKPETEQDTFIVDGRRTSETGNTEDVYRLHQDTVLFPETAWILLALSEKFMFHRIPKEAIAEVKKEALKAYQLSNDFVDSRIKEAVRVGYIKEIFDGDYMTSNRFSFEREYLVKLAQVFTSPSILEELAPKTN